MDFQEGSTFKSPSRPVNATRHQDLYKSRSPHWKATYRKRCMDRLKRNRDSVVSKLRDISVDNESVDELMTQEWLEMCREDISLPQLFGPENANNHSLKLLEDTDEITSIITQIKKELIEEEQQILREYESAQQYDIAALDAVVATCDASFVCCPICQRDRLMLNKSVVFCKCGTRIETEQDCITLDYIGQNLEEGVKQHSNGCFHNPAFAVVKQVGIDNLLMSCKACDFMYVVI